MESFDVVVVGSGAGGLAASAALATRGVELCCLEAMPELGGYLNPFRRERYRFDAGLHYLGQLHEQGVFRALLERLGAWDRVSFLPIDPEGFLDFRCGELAFRFPAGREALAARLGDRFPGEVRAIEALLARVVALDAAVEAASQMGTGLGPWLAALPHLPRLLAVLDRTWGDLVAATTGDPDLRSILCAMNAGTPPCRAAALIPALMLRHYLDGAWYPRGGSGALRDALVAVIREHGGEVRCQAPVEHICREGAGFVLRSAGTELRARAVVCNAHPSLLYGDLLDPSLVRDDVRRRAQGLEPSLGAFYAYVVTDLDLPRLGIGAASLQHVDSTAALEQEEGGSFLLSCTTAKDPEGAHAPAGLHVLEIVAPACFEPFAAWDHLPSMHRGEAYEAFKEELGWALIRRAERYAPGLADHVRYVNFATPLTNRSWVHAPAGGCYGPAHIPSQVGQRRFAIEDRVRGLFLCGAGTLAGGIYPSMRSGETAGVLAARFLGAGV